MVAAGLLTMKIMCRETKQRLLASALTLSFAQGLAAQDYNEQPTPDELAKLGLGVFPIVLRGNGEQHLIVREWIGMPAARLPARRRLHRLILPRWNRTLGITGTDGTGRRELGTF